MAGKRKELVDIYALLQHLRAGDSNRCIKRELGIDQQTAQKYQEWAEEYSLLKGSMPPIEELYQLLEETLPSQRPPQSQSSVEPYLTLVVKLREQGVEVSAIKSRLEEHGFNSNYMVVYRFVKQMEPDEPEVTVRVETGWDSHYCPKKKYGLHYCTHETGLDHPHWFPRCVAFARCP